MPETILERAKGLQGETVALRRWFHAHPEPSFKEYKTAARVREVLKQLGIEFQTAGETGTVGVIPGRLDHPVIALRADIDALEIHEKNEASYRSENDGLMHACGHDAHTAALLTAAKILVQQKDRLAGTIKLIFQPAEELGEGAAAVIGSGLLDDVDAFLGIHVRPGLPVGTLALQAGPVMAGANSLKIDVWGKSGHAGRPHETVDAIVAGAEIVGALQTIVSREIAPTEAVVISVSQFHAGTRDNIIANHARISGTVRVTSEEVRRYIAPAIRRVVAGISAAHQVESQVICDYATPVLYNSDRLYPIVREAAEKALPEISIQGVTAELGTEDFSAYGKIAPVFFAFVGTGGQFSIHHEQFDIDEEALAIAATLHASVAINYFERQER